MRVVQCASGSGRSAGGFFNRLKRAGSAAGVAAAAAGGGAAGPTGGRGAVGKTLRDMRQR